MWVINTFGDTTAEKDTICLYGDTGDGKTAQIGVYAKDKFLKTGKRTRVYTADPGGWRTLRAHAKVGIVEIVSLIEAPKPWEWIAHVVKGKVPVESSTGIDWVLDHKRNEEIGTYAFEGMTAFGDSLMRDAAKQSADGRHIGGQPPSFRYSEGDVKWAGNSQSHFGVTQTVMNAAIQDSLLLPGNVIWTAMAKRANDADLNSTILGPQLAGRAMTSDIPRLFGFTFRLMAIPADEMLNRAAEHRLYFDDYQDKMTVGAKGLGNIRLPLETFGEAPPYISPANVVEAIEMWETLTDKAEKQLLADIAAARQNTTGTAA